MSAYFFYSFISMIQRRIIKLAEETYNLPLYGFSPHQWYKNSTPVSQYERRWWKTLHPALFKNSCPRCRKMEHTASYCSFNKWHWCTSVHNVCIYFCNLLYNFIINIGFQISRCDCIFVNINLVSFRAYLMNASLSKLKNKFWSLL